MYIAQINHSMVLFISKIDDRSLSSVVKDKTLAVKELVTNQFMKQNIGDVSEVAIVSKLMPGGYVYYDTTVWLSKWYNTPESHSLQTMITITGHKTLSYSDSCLSFWPWKWTVSEKRATREEIEMQLRTEILEKNNVIDLMASRIEAMSDNVDMMTRRFETITGIANVTVVENPLPLPQRMVTSDVEYLQSLLLSRQVEIADLLRRLDEVVETASPAYVSDSVLPPTRSVNKLTIQRCS